MPEAGCRIQEDGCRMPDVGSRIFPRKDRKGRREFAKVIGTKLGTVPIF